ncbi:MAG: GerMN domain-containing protein [Sphaerochaetaceae bacterium]|nr:GerMN domain-containing protein [Sphaerochaetaceae bacterium]
MIEDIQYDLLASQENIPKKEKSVSRGFVLTIIFIIWLLYASLIILISFSKIKTSIIDSGILSIFKDYEGYVEDVAKKEVTLSFVLPSSGGSKQVLVTQLGSRTGVSGYHDVIEALLKGPSDSALALGAISMIDEKTELLGLSVSGNTAFVDLSGDFAGSGADWGTEGFENACSQVKETLKAFDSNLTDIVIMINGVLL